MIISTQPFLQKPFGLSWTENRMFVSRIQISVQFPGNLSCCQKLGGRFIRMWSHLKGSVSSTKRAKEWGNRRVDRISEFAGVCRSTQSVHGFSVSPIFSWNLQTNKLYAGMGPIIMVFKWGSGRHRHTKNKTLNYMKACLVKFNVYIIIRPKVNQQLLSWYHWKIFF